jgi:rhodanese-related sulfurtransferase
MNRLIEYASHHSWLFSATVLAVFAVIAYEWRERSQGMHALAPQEVIRLMNHGALLIDLRPAEQFGAGHIAGARSMTGEEILQAGETLKKHREKPVVVYCESGSLAGAAVRQLAAQGFSRAFTLRGGLAGWRGESLPLAKQ